MEKDKKLFVPFSTDFRVKVIEKPSRGRSKTLKTFDCGVFGSAELIANAQIMELMELYNYPYSELVAYQKENVQGVSMNIDGGKTIFYIEIHRI